jgi:hypothetical protein
MQPTHGKFCVWDEQQKKVSRERNSICDGRRSQREEIDVKQFTVEDCVDETALRLPDSISGAPFSISNCLKSNIFLLDHINTVTITDCRECVILIGPTKGR